MELVLNNNFTSLDLNELENIDGGNFASKVGSGLILVGTIVTQFKSKADVKNHLVLS